MPVLPTDDSVLRRVGGLAATGCLIAAVITLLGLAVGPRLFDYRTATMLTGSMSGVIRPGDVVIDTPEPRADVRPGQIITYGIPVGDHHVESHRVVSVVRHEGAIDVRTKGDANAAADPWTARITAPRVWRVRWVVPYAGTAIRALRTPMLRPLLLGALPAALVVGALVAIWRPRHHAPERPGVPPCSERS